MASHRIHGRSQTITRLMLLLILTGGVCLVGRWPSNRRMG